ncbi:MAG: TIGR00730 family Rossman fold protein [Chitinophagaceae bacterium]
MAKKTPLKRVIPAGREVYLDGPKPRIWELSFAFTVFKEFIKGFRALHFVGPCITVFGSARFKPDHHYYKIGEAFGKRIADLGFTTLTGGGPGIMEAANKGAFENGGTSIGVNIVLPHEQHANPYVHKSITMRYFFIRKVLLVKYSYAFIILPGGFGTMDEFFEALTLVQTRTIHSFPIVLFGKRYYQELYRYMEYMVKEGTVSSEDMNLILLTDDFDEAMQHIQKYIRNNYEVKPRKRLPWFFEKR